MKFILGIIKEDENNPEILVRKHAYEFDHIEKQFEQASFDNFIQELHAVIDRYRKQDGEFLEVMVYSDVDMDFVEEY